LNISERTRSEERIGGNGFPTGSAAQSCIAAERRPTRLILLLAFAVMNSAMRAPVPSDSFAEDLRPERKGFPSMRAVRATICPQIIWDRIMWRAKRMLQPEKPWFDRRRASRPSRPARRRVERSAKRLSEDRRFEINQNERSTVREELVDRVRQEIKAGTYDTLIKMEAAFDRLLIQFS
jgi:hypothetical protein